MSDSRPVIYDAEKIARLPELSRGDQHHDLVEVQKYLLRFGYLPSSEAINEGEFDQPTANALAAFQRYFGVGREGCLDAATRSAMTLERCGLPDIVAPGFQTRCAWNRRNLTYAFGQSTGQAVGADAAQDAVRAAFQTWITAGVGLEFTELGQNQNPDILVEWTDANCPDSNMIGPALAHADFPPGCSINTNSLPLPIHFDDDEHTWSVSGNHNAADIDIETVALHEIGHILGLLHEPAIPGSVMFPAYDGIRRELDTDSQAGIRALYPLRQQHIRVSLPEIPFNKRVELAVYADDAETGQPVSGTVQIRNPTGEIGEFQTNEEFRFTFKFRQVPNKPGEFITPRGSVVKNGYFESPVPFVFVLE